ncbi:hypothetical protein [Longispora albida]|uniref:hypothetical protein n=1 Tax=Longispora albida TaxID=203523 RepID=UPI00039CD712|nr:hypothetical protein [Longispora albida]
MRLEREAIIVAEAHALFISPLPSSRTPTRLEATEAIRRGIREHGGSRGCAAEVAYEYGDHPETAAARMRWARTVAQGLSARAARNRAARDGTSGTRASLCPNSTIGGTP